MHRLPMKTKKTQHWKAAGLAAVFKKVRNRASPIEFVLPQIELARKLEKPNFIEQWGCIEV